MSVPLIGSMIWEGNYTVKNNPEYKYGARLKYFDYNWWKPEDEKIVLFSDLWIQWGAHPRFAEVPFRVAWMLEGPAVYKWGQFSPVRKWLLSNLDVFTAVVTCNDSLVAQYPNKFVYVPYGQINVPLEDVKVYEKTKLCSLFAGTKYPPRDVIYLKYKDSGKVDFLGRAFGRPCTSQTEGFKDYMYHISIESSSVDTYFTSNLSNAFACGTVPIWWGCQGISKFFNMNGVISINSIDELDEVLKKINPEDYIKRLPAIIENQKLVERFRIPENNLWENVLSELYGRNV